MMPIKPLTPVVPPDSASAPCPLFPPSSTEDDPYVLVRRAKQIESGRNTADYGRYVKMVEKEDRVDWMPRTPDMSRKYSRQEWDGLVEEWKNSIHVTVSRL